MPGTVAMKTDSTYFVDLYPYYGYETGGGMRPWTSSWPNVRPGGGRLA